MLPTLSSRAEENESLKANRSLESRDLVFREHHNARRIHLLGVYGAKRFETHFIHRNDQQSSKKDMGAQEPHSRGFHRRLQLYPPGYWESFDDVVNAINREKQLKRWRREKKEWLIVRKNPHWEDLAADWFAAETKGPSTALGMSKIEQKVPRLRSG